MTELLDDCVRADDAALIITELAANCCLHSASGGNGSFVVRCGLQQSGKGFVWIEVEDEGGPWRIRQPDDRPHGLDIVEVLAGTGNRGIGDLADGRRVAWARLDLS